MKKLSRPQIEGLCYTRGRQLYAQDINEGDGNVRRTLLWLIKHGLLGWDPIYHGRVVVTAAGQEQLQRDQDRKRDARAKLGAGSRPTPDPLRAVSPAPRWWWNGLCPAGKHGLDFEGQRCDLCAATEAEP